MADWIDSPKDHDPKWHEFGVLRHTLRVFQNAQKIKDLTGIDIVKVALWHDIGKFVPGVRQRKIRTYTFKGHEEASREWLKENRLGFNEEELFLIENHAKIRKSSVKEIVDSCKDNQKLNEP